MKVFRFVTFLLLGFVVLGVGLLVASAFTYRSTRTFLASDEIHVFESERIWFNPRDYIPSGGIDVYVDPFDLAKYHMDISFLPRLAGRG